MVRGVQPLTTRSQATSIKIEPIRIRLLFDYYCRYPVQQIHIDCSARGSLKLPRNTKVISTKICGTHPEEVIVQLTEILVMNECRALTLWIDGLMFYISVCNESPI